MRISRGEVVAYRTAANRQRKKDNHDTTILDNCVDLAKRMAVSPLTEYAGLYLPIHRKQPEALVGAIATGGALKVVLPICPPVPYTPNTFRPELSPEAKAGVRAARVLCRVFAKDIGIDVIPKLLIADTETDLESIMERAGGAKRYLEVCAESADLTGKQLSGVATVSTFSQYFNNKLADVGGFHGVQYRAQSRISSGMEFDDRLRRKITRTSMERSAKHAQILGRPEQECELAIRYAAQYMALGDYIRTTNEFDTVCNYPTPNNEFYNSRVNCIVANNDSYSLGDNSVIPVFESRVDKT